MVQERVASEADREALRFVRGAFLAESREAGLY
jgi:hypothetical protein